MWVKLNLPEFVTTTTTSSETFSVCVCSDAAETVIHSADAFAPVGYLRFTEMHTESKDSVSLSELLKESKSVTRFTNKISAAQWWINHFATKVWVAAGSITLKPLWGQNKYKSKTFWCLITLSSRRETRHCGAGFRSTSRGPPSFSLSLCLAHTLALGLSLHPSRSLL